MINYKLVSKVGIILVVGSFSFFSIKDIQQKKISTESLSTIENVLKDTNFKLEFKNLNELEYIVQDSLIDSKNTGFNKTFKKNNKFDILINDNGKVISINYTTNLDDMNNNDMEYIQKLYNFVFNNISSYMLDKTNEIIKNVKSEEYINLNKSSLMNNGYLQESIPLNKTSQLLFTTYYKIDGKDINAYKLSLDILQGSKY